jgi:hypothetical protein
MTILHAWERSMYCFGEFLANCSIYLTLEGLLSFFFFAGISGKMYIAKVT